MKFEYITKLDNKEHEKYLRQIAWKNLVLDYEKLVYLLFEAYTLGKNSNNETEKMEWYILDCILFLILFIKLLLIRGF